MSKLLSIIIPSYNMENYLPKCLGSVLACGGGECGAGGAFSGIDRRACAEKKVEEWLAGVDEATFEAALAKLVEEKTAAGEYRFKKPEDRALALEGARRSSRSHPTSKSIIRW